MECLRVRSRVISFAAKETARKVRYRRCAGLDVHRKSISVRTRVIRGKKVDLHCRLPNYMRSVGKRRVYVKTSPASL